MMCKAINITIIDSKNMIYLDYDKYFENISSDMNYILRIINLSKIDRYQSIR